MILWAHSWGPSQSLGKEILLLQGQSFTAQPFPPQPSLLSPHSHIRTHLNELWLIFIHPHIHLSLDPSVSIFSIILHLDIFNPFLCSEPRPHLSEPHSCSSPKSFTPFSLYSPVHPKQLRIINFPKTLVYPPLKNPFITIREVIMSEFEVSCNYNITSTAILNELCLPNSPLRFRFALNGPFSTLFFFLHGTSCLFCLLLRVILIHLSFLLFFSLPS